MMSDLRLAVRALRATPIVTVAAILSLALGIGANTAIFSIVHSVLLRTLPVPQPQRLVTVSSSFAIAHGFKAGTGWNYDMWRRFQPQAAVPGAEAEAVFDEAFAWYLQPLNLARGGETQKVDGIIASGDFFATLGVPALLGRTFTARDDVRGGGPDGPVVVISHRLWQRRFGGAPNVIGRQLAIERVPFTIVGVTAPEFVGLEVGQAFDVAVPLGTDTLLHRARSVIDSPQSFALTIMLRLKAGQSLEAATAAINTMQPRILGGIAAQMPPMLKEPYVLVPAATGTSDRSKLRQQYERPLLTIFAVVGLVLLIACCNIANLQLARASARHHELSVRRALGAPRWRLARLWLVESLVLAAAGAMLGILFAIWAGGALVAQLSTAGDPVFGGRPIVLGLSLDWRTLAFTMLVTMATAILFGVAPAWRAARAAPIEALNVQGGRASVSARSSVSGSLVVAQVALSLVLIVGAGLFLRTFERLAQAPLGFDPERVLVMAVDTAQATMAVDGDAQTKAQTKGLSRARLRDRLLAAVAAVPGVTHASASASTPAGGGGGNVIADANGRALNPERRVLWNIITPEWFATYGIPLHAGRDFTARDAAATAPVVIVNEAFVRRFFPGGDAIGATLDNSINEWLKGRTIVGVAGDVAYTSRRDVASAVFYLPFAQAEGLGPPGQTTERISVRVDAGPPARLTRSLAAAVEAVDRDVTFSFRAMADNVRVALAQERLIAWLSGFFGALALLLSALGLYGVTAYAVSRRRREIGIRMALGAAPDGVVRLMLSRVCLLVGVGIAAGAAIGLWLSRLVAPLLFGLPPHDPVTLAAAALILAAVGGIAGWLPASRAARVEPVDALRRG